MENKKYLLLYYVSFVITLLFIGFSSYKFLELVSDGGISFGLLLSEMFDGILSIINVILVIVFTVLLIKKKKIQVKSNLFPIMYICFFIIVVSLCFIFNARVIIPYMHFKYYTVFINVGYLFLNIYSLLSVKTNK